MRDPSRVVVTGPLAAYRDGFAEVLVEQGYIRECTARQLQLMAHLSGWMDSRGLGVGDLTAAGRVEGFAAVRRGEGRILFSERALRPLLGYLGGLGVVATVARREATTETERLVEYYRRYLVSERGLAEQTISAYLRTAELFLGQLEPDSVEDLGRLSAAVVRSFVIEQCRPRRVAAAQALVVGLRSLLRFLFLAGYLPWQLASVVPTPAGFSGGCLPRGLKPEVVAALLSSCDHVTVRGRRDFAILTMLARLGLRAAEVAALSLDDIDWDHGEIVVCGKGGRRDRLPVPVDVGEALVAYIGDGRPGGRCRWVFMRVTAPIGGLSPGGVGDVVRSACRRAGVPPSGPHRLRHSAATAMLAGGASLVEVGQVLRQVRASTTSIYAKVDRLTLQSLAQPWPEVRS